MTSPVDGFVAPGFESVREAFASNFADHGEVGGAVAAWVGGEPVVSLWGGLADADAGRPWSEDTIVLVFSMTKALTATCVHHLAERGGLDVDLPVAHYWPEFAAGGKSAITVRDLLSHRAGLPAVEGEFTLEEALAWEPVVEALAAQEPRWAPGTTHGYHLRTFGWLVGEVFLRASGRTVGRYFADEIAGPLGIDWYLGLPEGEESRVATLVPPPDEFHELVASMPDDVLLPEAMATPSGLFRYDEMWNRRELRAAELPSTNSVTNAAAAARFYAALLGEAGGPILEPKTLAAATEVRSKGTDRVLMVQTGFGTGYMVPPALPARAGSRSFGHSGAGGSTGFADPDAGLAFAYTPNRLQFGMADDPRSEGLVDAVYRCLGGSRDTSRP